MFPYYVKIMSWPPRNANKLLLTKFTEYLSLTVLLLLQPPENLEVAEVELEDAGVEPKFQSFFSV
jgi:hypothetical protein